MAGYPINLDSALLPSRDPTGAPGGDFENIHADSDMFGGAVARSLEGFGQSVEKVSNEGFQIARQQREIEDRTRASDLHSTFTNQATDLSSQFLQLQGAAAQRALPEHKKNLEGLYNDAIANAPDPYTKQMLMQETRRSLDEQYKLASSHAASQEKTYQKNTATLSEQAFGNEAVLFASNGDIITAKQKLFRAGLEVRNQAELQGYEGPALDQLVAKGRGHYAEEITKAIANKEGPGGGYIAAAQFYRSEMGDIDAESRTKIDAFLRSGLTAAAGRARGEEAYGHGTQHLSSTTTAVKNDAAAALENVGVPLRVTSEYRSPEHNAAVGGARGSQHLHGNAIDVSLTGLNPDQQKAVVSQFLSDPRVGGFGFYPRSNSIHVDVRQGDRAAWGTDYHGTSVGEGWPSWLTQQVRAWQGGQGASAAGVQPTQGAPERVMPASFQPSTSAQTEAPTAAAFPVMPQSNLPTAIMPSWQEKRAVALQRLMDDPDLRDRPQLFNAAVATVNRMAEIEHAGVIDDSAAEKAQEKAAKMASDARTLEILGDLNSPNPRITASQVVADGQKGLLTREAVEKLLTYLPKRPDMAHDTQTYGPGFYEAFNAVNLPQGDPGKITDPSKLLPMVGKSLTISGYDKLSAEIYKPKNPETEAENIMKKRAQDYAYRHISGKDDRYGIKDERGEELFMQWLPHFFEAYDKGKKEGRTPSELLSIDSPHSVLNSINSFKRSQQEIAADLKHDNPFGNEEKPAEPGFFSRMFSRQKFDIGTAKSADELKAALHRGDITYDQAMEAGIRNGWIRAMPPAAPAAPVAAPEEVHVPVSR